MAAPVLDEGNQRGFGSALGGLDPNEGRVAARQVLRERVPHHQTDRELGAGRHALGERSIQPQLERPVLLRISGSRHRRGADHGGDGENCPEGKAMPGCHVPSTPSRAVPFRPRYPPRRMTNMIELTPPVEKAFLLAVDTGEDAGWTAEDSLAELANLATTAGAEVVGAEW